MSWETGVLLILAVTVALTIVPDFLAHVSRYRGHRRHRPGHSRGYAWQVTRDR